MIRLNTLSAAFIALFAAAALTRYALSRLKIGRASCRERVSLNV